MNNYINKKKPQPYPLNFIDEQSGERSHKRYKYSRPHLARKTSPEDNLTDMMRVSLAWSDPKLSDLEYRSKPHKARDSEADFTREMARFYAYPEIVEETSAINSDEDEDSKSGASDADSVNEVGEH